MDGSGPRPVVLPAIHPVTLLRQVHGALILRLVIHPVTATRVVLLLGHILVTYPLMAGPGSLAPRVLFPDPPQDLGAAGREFVERHGLGVGAFGGWDYVRREVLKGVGLAFSSRMAEFSNSFGRGRSPSHGVVFGAPSVDHPQYWGPLYSNSSQRPFKRYKKSINVRTEKALVTPPPTVIPTGIPERVLNVMSASATWDLNLITGTSFSLAIVSIDDEQYPFDWAPAPVNDQHVRGYHQYFGLYNTAYPRACRYKVKLTPRSPADATTGPPLVLGSYVGMYGNYKPTTLREAIEGPSTTQNRWDLGYRCTSNTSVVNAQLAPYEREGYVDVSKDLARCTYGTPVPGFYDNDRLYLWVFAGTADGSDASSLMSCSLSVELQMLVEWSHPKTPSASNV